jgi:orotate phosphoribosyltransferase
VSDPRPAGSSEDEVRDLLRASGALAEGHFELSSGRHSPAYVQCALLLEEPERARRIGRALARLVASLRPRSVVAPALGGVVIGHEVAAALGVPFRFTERSREGRMEMRRGFRLEAGERVVVVEDVVTTGRSTREAAEVVRAAGGEVVAVGSIVNRAGDDNPFDVPYFALLDLELPTWTAQECPLCAEGGTAVKPGSRPR